jgi:hypothetical protein
MTLAFADYERNEVGGDPAISLSQNTEPQDIGM